MTFALSLNIDDLPSWADGIMASRPPDFWVGEEGAEQLKRWYILPRNEAANVFLHLFLRDDPVFHDHPYDNATVVIRGAYREYFHSPFHINQPYIDRHAGEFIQRNALTMHRVGLIDGPAVSLFLTGPRVRDWGFLHGNNYMLAKDDPHYTETRHWLK